MSKPLLLVLLASTLAGGCVVRSTRSPGPQPVARRGCPPAHHWDGYACVHNGKHHGNDK